MHAKKMSDGLRGGMIGEQNERQIVVGIGVCSILAKNGAEFRLGEIKFSLRDENVAEIVAGLRRAWVNLQAVFERVLRGGEIALIDADDSKEIVGFDARGIAIDFGLNFLPGFIELAFFQEYFDFWVPRGLF